jgi:hypothetical protein
MMPARGEPMDDPAFLGEPPRPTSAAEGLVLQRLPLGRHTSLRDLYVRAKDDTAAFPARCRIEEARLFAARGAALSFDTYFGAFFEQAWRGPTALRSSRSTCAPMAPSRSGSCAARPGGRKWSCTRKY